MNYKNNKLFIDNIKVDQIIKKIKTPLYCYSFNN